MWKVPRCSQTFSKDLEDIGVNIISITGHAVPLDLGAEKQTLFFHCADSRSVICTGIKYRDLTTEIKY